MKLSGGDQRICNTILLQHDQPRDKQQSFFPQAAKLEFSFPDQQLLFQWQLQNVCELKNRIGKINKITRKNNQKSIAISVF